MATFTKRDARGKIVWGAQIRRKGHPTLSATFERLMDAKQWAARQEAAISEERAVPGRAARQHTIANSLLSDSRVLRDQEFNERRQQRFTALADVMHKLEETEVQREFFL